MLISRSPTPNSTLQCGESAAAAAVNLLSLFFFWCDHKEPIYHLKRPILHNRAASLLAKSAKLAHCSGAAAAMSEMPTRWLHHRDSLLGFSLVARGNSHSVASVQQLPSWGLERSVCLCWFDLRAVAQNNPKMFDVQSQEMVRRPEHPGWDEGENLSSCISTTVWIAIMIRSRFYWIVWSTWAVINWLKKKHT